MREEQLNDLLNQLNKEKRPPEGLRTRILNELKDQKLIKDKMETPKIIKWTVGIAAAILLFLGGTYFERLNQMDMIQIEPTRGYILLLHEDERFTPGDPMQMFSEYKNWMEDTFEKGIKITGQELKEEVVVVGNSGTIQSSDAYKKTTGYFILEAETMEAAVQVARDNPHIKYGGEIEVKPYMVR